MLQAAAALSPAGEDTDLEEDACENEVAPASTARALTDRLAAEGFGVPAGESLGQSGHLIVVASIGARVTLYRPAGGRGVWRATR